MLKILSRNSHSFCSASSILIFALPVSGRVLVIEKIELSQKMSTVEELIKKRQALDTAIETYVDANVVVKIEVECKACGYDEREWPIVSIIRGFKSTRINEDNNTRILFALNSNDEKAFSRDSPCTIEDVELYLSTEGTPKRFYRFKTAQPCPNDQSEITFPPLFSGDKPWVLRMLRDDRGVLTAVEANYDVGAFPCLVREIRNGAIQDERKMFQCIDDKKNFAFPEEIIGVPMW